MRAAELLQLASQKGFNDLRALPVVPEDDNCNNSAVKH